METLREVRVTLEGAAMHGSVTATASVCGDGGGLPTSATTDVLLPLATSCVAGPTPLSSFKIVTVTFGCGSDTQHEALRWTVNCWSGSTSVSAMIGMAICFCVSPEKETEPDWKSKSRPETAVPSTVE